MSENNKKKYSYSQYERDFSKEERYMFEDFLIRSQLRAFQDKYNSPELSIEKARDFAENNEVDNTYADPRLIERFDDNWVEYDEFDPGKIDWNGLFDYIKGGGDQEYILRCNAGAACILMKFNKNGLIADCEWPADNLPQFICDQLNGTGTLKYNYPAHPEWTYRSIKDAIEEIRTERRKGTVFSWDNDHACRYCTCDTCIRCPLEQKASRQEG